MPSLCTLLPSPGGVGLGAGGNAGSGAAMQTRPPRDVTHDLPTPVKWRRATFASYTPAGYSCLTGKTFS
ncbi:hypothetical protein E2C01_068452 [Portunus trituberculatus]|uniref:Uncharacterized protein n=1 Tax=Portunus trituberculatus TaxID=210409 RepID=A0A5B7HWI0_PORTR|nr:hypothetical protein [Portunus trituberculatus]